MIWVSVLPGIWESEMTAILTRFLVLLWVLMSGVSLQAQPAAGDADPIEQQVDDAAGDENASGDEQSDTGNAETDLPDIDSQPIDDSQNQGPGRFIPSEQISQDFGVSFPVDI